MAALKNQLETAKHPRTFFPQRTSLMKWKLGSREIYKAIPIHVDQLLLLIEDFSEVKPYELAELQIILLYCLKYLPNGPGDRNERSSVKSPLKYPRYLRRTCRKTCPTRQLEFSIFAQYPQFLVRQKSPREVYMLSKMAQWYMENKLHLIPPAAMARVF